MKPAPPEYPRKVPDINFDEDPIYPGTIVYTEDSDDEAADAEEFEKRRAAKRRRIERNAHAYLRGEGLFILTAGLQGPFDHSWENPWATRGRKRKADVINDESAVARARKVLRRDHVTTQTPWKSKQIQQAQPDPFAAARSATNRQLTPDEKVEKWLRRNAAPPYDERVSEPASPTPKRKSTTHDNSGKRRDWTPVKQVIAVSSQNAKAPLQLVNKRVSETSEILAPKDEQHLQPVGSHTRLQNALATGRQSEPDTSDEASRAETAIKKMKARNWHSISHKHPKAEQFDNIQLQSPRKSINVPPAKAENVEIKLKKLETAVDDQLRQPVEKIRHSKQKIATKENVTEKSKSDPVSAVQSDAQSIVLPPSAQPRPELQTSVSNISSGVLLLNQQPSQTNITPKTGLENVSDPCENPKLPLVSNSFDNENPAETSDSKDMSQVANNEQKLVQQDNLNADAIDRVESSQPEEESQQKVNAQRPQPDAVKVTDATEMGSVQQDLAVRSQPSSVSKYPLSAKKRKSTTFAAEATSFSSNGSIKSVLRVKKRSKPSMNKEATPPPPFQPLDIDMDTSIEQDEIATKFDRVKKDYTPRNIHPSRSILKTSKPTASSAPPAIKDPPVFSASSPSKRRASQVVRTDIMVSGQNGLVHVADEDFDLDGAIDEIGSFLSTWDAEKDAIRV